MGTGLWLRLKALAGRRRLDRDLDEELRFHLAMRERNTPPDEARRVFGNVTRVKENCRELWTFTWLETFLQDLRHGLRHVRHSPGFTAVAVLSLALGIGANTALFSLINAMLLRALPVRNPQELVEFIRVHPEGSRMSNLPFAVFTELRRNRSVLAGVFAIRWSAPVLRAGGGTERAIAYEVSGSFFRTLGVGALLGRPLGPEDDRVAVLSYPFWSRRLGRDPSVLGSNVRLSGKSFKVIGVMPADFVGVDRSEVPDAWVPLDPRPGEVWVLGRLKPGVSIARAHAELAPLFQRALESMREEFRQSPARQREAFLSQRLLIHPARNGTVALRWSYWEYSATLKILVALSGLVLLIACANLANLLMGRAAARGHEIAIRLAIGAGRRRLIRQLLTENLLLSVAGGALGLLAAAWGHRLLLACQLREPGAAALDFRLDARLLAFGLALALLTGLLSGVFPAVRATRAEQVRSAVRIPLARTLLVIQFGLSLVLLAGAGLFARSLANLGATDLGFARESLALVDVRPAPGQTPEARQQFWRRLTERVSALPGVRSATLAGDAVFGNGGWSKAVWIQRPGQPPEAAQIACNFAGPGFFDTVGIPLLAGREFAERDRENAPLVAVVNQSFARRFFAGQSPLGRRFGDSGPGSLGRYEIVGVIADAKYGSVREGARSMVYQPLAQQHWNGALVLHVRAAGSPSSLLGSVRREIAALDDDALVARARTVPDVLRTQLRQDRMLAALAGFFALLALALGGIGVYGAVAYRVARRTGEIGLRMALGAQRADVLWLVMREIVALLGAGIALGLPAALAASRLVKSLLFALPPWDPATFAAAIVTLCAAGALAGFLPARRAASIEPVMALRQE